MDLEALRDVLSKLRKERAAERTRHATFIRDLDAQAARLLEAIAVLETNKKESRLVAAK